MYGRIYNKHHIETFSSFHYFQVEIRTRYNWEGDHSIVSPCREGNSQEQFWKDIVLTCQTDNCENIYVSSEWYYCTDYLRAPDPESSQPINLWGSTEHFSSNFLLEEGEIYDLG